MPRSTPKYQIQLTPEQLEFLTKLSRTHTAPFAQVQRARILLLAHQSLGNAEIARRVGCSDQTVRNWRRRFGKKPSVSDAERSGHPRRLTPIERAAVTALACSSPRDHDRPWQRWSGEKLARARDWRKTRLGNFSEPRAPVVAPGKDQTLALSFVAEINRP